MFRVGYKAGKKLGMQGSAKTYMRNYSVFGSPFSPEGSLKGYRVRDVYECNLIVKPLN